MTDQNNNGNYVPAEPVTPPAPEANAAPQQGAPEPQQAPPQYQQAPPQYQQAPPQYQQAPPQVADPVFNPADVEAGKAFAILGYIFPLLFFLPLVSGAKTPYAMFHANNALILFIGGIVASILSVILIGFLLYVFLLVLIIMGIIAACNGSAKRLPLIGGMIILK